MEFSFVNQRSNLGIMVDHQEAPNELDNSLMDSNSSENISSVVVSSSDSDLEEEEEEEEEEVTSGQLGSGPLHDMSSLLQQLPIKRGLSKHFQGKSQSFTSLSNVRGLEDLPKPEINPHNKKLKSCKSYGLILLNQTHMRSFQPSRTSPSSSSRPLIMSKRAILKGSCSSLGVKRTASTSCLVNKPPINPHRSASTRGFCNQTPLFA